MLEPVNSNVTIINPSVSLIMEPDPLKRLELIGRSCYQSAHRITADSAPKFVADRITVGHESILEHYRLDIMPEAHAIAVMAPAYNRHILYYRDNGVAHMVGNVRAFRDLIRTLLAVIEEVIAGDLYVAPAQTLADGIFFNLMKARREVLPWPHDRDPLTTLGYEKDTRRHLGDSARTVYAMQQPRHRQDEGNLAPLISFSPILQEINTIIKWNSILFGDLEPKFQQVVELIRQAGRPFQPFLTRSVIRESDDGLTVRIIADRAIINELERHREEFSYMQESTRYVKYTEALQFVAPFGNVNDAPTEKAMLSLISTISGAKAGYDLLTDKNGLHMQPQFARSVLPLGMKSEVFVTAPLSAWARMADLRIQPDVHPQFRELIVILLNLAVDATNNLYRNAEEIRHTHTQRTS